MISDKAIIDKNSKLESTAEVGPLALLIKKLKLEKM